MILAPGSPLKRLPQLNPRQGMFFDAIRLTIEMGDFAMERLYANLVRMTSLGSASGGPVSFAVEPFLDAWSAVDSIHRLSGLLKKCRASKKGINLPIFGAFQRSPIRERAFAMRCNI